MNATHRTIILFAAALIAALLGGCASTEIVSAWKDPALARVPFGKVLVVFQHSDSALRHQLERTMAALCQVLVQRPAAQNRIDGLGQRVPLARAQVAVLAE